MPLPPRSAHHLPTHPPARLLPYRRPVVATVLVHAEAAHPARFAQQLAGRMVTSARESHDAVALQRWSHCHAAIEQALRR